MNSYTINNQVNPFNNQIVRYQQNTKTSNYPISTTTPAAKNYQLAPFEIARNNALYLKDEVLARVLPQNYIAKHLTAGFISKQIQNNAQIQKILSSHNLPIKFNPQNVLNITNSHLIPTTQYAKLIMQRSGIPFSPQDYTIMEQAALLHDIGKGFIPSEILNKKENLTTEERKIIELHDTLGVELLKNTQLSPQVLTLIGAHHNYDGNEDNSILTQILKIADIYSALKEKRSYKTALSEKETFEVLYKKANEGEFNPKLVDILYNGITNNLQKPVVA